MFHNHGISYSANACTVFAFNWKRVVITFQNASGTTRKTENIKEYPGIVIRQYC
jgi:hypothetical protein